MKVRPDLVAKIEGSDTNALDSVAPQNAFKINHNADLWKQGQHGPAAGNPNDEIPMPLDPTVTHK
jgi:hypothetical protein